MINDQFLCCFANTKYIQWERYEFKFSLKLITIHFNNPSKSLRALGGDQHTKAKKVLKIK